MERPWLALFCLLLIATAGCADKSSTTPTDVSDPEPTGTQPDPEEKPATKPSEPSQPAEPPAPEPENRAPTAKLRASVESGLAPLAVKFDVDGSDPDGDDLSWGLDLDGDATIDAEGAKVPDSYEYLFEDPGEYTITLTVSDAKLVGSDSISIEVLEDVPAGPLYSWSGSVEESCKTTCGAICDPVLFCYASLGAFGCTGFLTDEQGGECIWFVIPADAVGRDFEVTSTAGDPDMQFIESCAPSSNDPAERAPAVVFGTGYFGTNGAETGQVPDDYSCAVVWEWNDGPSDISFVIM